MNRRRILLAASLGALAGVLGANEADTPDDVLQPAAVTPLFPIGEKGHNDSSPIWAPTGTLLAFERAEQSRREIVIARRDGSIAKTVYYQPNTDDVGLAALLPSLGKAESYNSGISWSPQADRFVFMSNAGEGNYDLYLGSFAAGAVQRLTRDPAKDGQPGWSPRGDKIAFVSGRAGGARLFLLDVASHAATLLSKGDRPYLYPRWSPDGQRIVAIAGDNENHDIVVFEDVIAAKNGVTAKERALTTWPHDDLGPSWSPDGKKIAFYTNYNADNDPKVWALVVVDARGSSPTEGDGLAAHIVARNVIPDVMHGPAWMPDSRRIAYVRNDKRDYSPIYIVDIDTRKNARIATGTNINNDLSISPDGVLAFRAQVEQWDRIFLVKLPD
jgi:Tol biopolymer transport system component